GFARGYIGQLQIRELGALERALNKTQRVEGCGKNSAGCDDGRDHVDVEGSEQDEEFADEVAQAGESERCEREEQTRAAESGDRIPEAAHDFNVACAEAVFEGSGND